MIRKILRSSGILSDTTSREERLRQNIIRHEARVGGTIFGRIPAGVRREFFCLDEYTWIWYEEWIEDNRRRSRTTRYNVLADGVLKSINGQGYRKVDNEEAHRLLEAAGAYQRKVETEVYQPILRAL